MKYFTLKMSDYSIEVKSRYINPFCYILGTVALSNSYIYAFKFKSSMLAISCFLSGLAAFLIPISKKYILKSHVILANVVVTIFLGCIIALTAFTGGIYSNPIWWLGSLPLVATFLMNSLFGAIWFFIILLTFSTIFYLGRVGLLPENVLLDITQEGRLIVSFIFNATLIAGLCILADIIRDKSFLEKEDLKLKTFHLNKIVSLGKLASGVAHEINNPLTVLKGTRYKISRMLTSEQGVNIAMLEQQMEKIERNLIRIQEVTSLMRNISEKSMETKISRMHIQKLLADILQMLSEDITRSMVDVDFKCSNDDIHFNGKYNEIFQAFYNIVENAVHELKAMPSDNKKLTLKITEDDQQILVFVQDNGRGIAPQIRNKIFDPFFTTKNIGEGKGLGLNFSFNTFTNKGGGLELVDSQTGSIFKVTLPKTN